MQINVVPQPFEIVTYITLECEEKIETIDYETPFINDNGETWYLLDLEVENLIPFYLKCNNYSGPVWKFDDTLQIVPDEIHTILKDHEIRTTYELDEYLFEPDISKIQDISDYDEDKGHVPRIDVFGDYIGDGILEPRRKVSKGVFHGWVEDLNDLSEIQMLDESKLSFHPTTEKITLKSISDPIHVLCYNADVLVVSGNMEIRRGIPWILPNLPLIKYSDAEKFVIQCFEIIRLTHLDLDSANLMKFISLEFSCLIDFSNYKYDEYAASLYLFLLQLKNFDNAKEDSYFDVPVFHSFTKSTIYNCKHTFEEFITTNEFEDYQNFNLNLNNVLSDSENSIYTSTISIFDTYIAKKVNKIYSDYVKELKSPLWQFFMQLEMYQKLIRVDPKLILKHYTIFMEPVITKYPLILELITELRKLSFYDNVFLLKGFIPSSSFLYNMLAGSYYTLRQPLSALKYIWLSNHFTHSLRDYVQLVYSYSDILTQLNQYSHRERIIDTASNFIFGDYNDFDQLLDVSHYRLLTLYILRSKIYVNKNYNVQLDFLIKGIIIQAKKMTDTLPELTSYEIELGLSILEGLPLNLDFHDSILLLKTRSKEIIDIIYQIETTYENPDIDRIIEISEFFLLSTKNQVYYSQIFKIEFNFVSVRLKYILNLFIFYHLINDKKKYTKLRDSFIEEFSESIDSDKFQDLLNIIDSESQLIEYILSKSHLWNYFDYSIINFVKIKKIVETYFITYDKFQLIYGFNKILEDAKQYENFRSRFECLKILYRLMISVDTLFPNLNKIRNELTQYCRIYGLNTEEIILKPIDDDALSRFITKENIPLFLSILT